MIKQLRLIKEKEAVLCYTARKLYSHRGKDLKRIIHVQESSTYQELLYGNSIVCSSVLIRRDILIKLPMEHDEYHEDDMLWLKCLKKYKRAYGIDEALVCYRLSTNGKSRNRIRSARMTYGMHRCMGMNRLEAFFIQDGI